MSEPTKHGDWRPCRFCDDEYEAEHDPCLNLAHEVCERAAALVAKLDAIKLELDGQAAFCAAHGYHWTGETYGADLESLRVALSAKRSEPGEA